MINLINVKNIFKIPELTKKLLITLGILIVYRLGARIPAIGVNIDLVKQFLAQSKQFGGLLGYLDMISGGSLSQSTIFALGIGPYITASIMMQMLSMAVPSLEQLSKEGEYGRRIINQYTRYLTIFLSIGYSLGYAKMLESQNLVITPGLGFKFLFVLTLTTGAVLVMWLGEQISLYGIGNGSSLIIFAGIISGFPNMIIKTWNAVSMGNLSLLTALFVLALFIGLAACVVFLEKGERKIPVQYSRRVVGQRVYAGQSTYIPFKVNPSGVMPAILAGSVISIPLFIAQFFSDRIAFFRTIVQSLQDGGFVYNTVDFSLIFFFTFFYTALLFNAQDLAEQLKKSGGFIPTIRPGKQTAQYFDYVLTRIAFIGALYLGFLAIFPNIIIKTLSMPFVLRGTSLLIVVGVALELAAQIESYLIEHRYEGFLRSGRLKTRVAR